MKRQCNISGHFLLTRERLRLVTDHLFITDEAVNYLCSMFGEEEAIFCEEATAAGPPILVGHTLVVEGVNVAQIPASAKKDDLLLCWGAAFAVYAQKPTSRRYENVAFILTNKVLQTDIGSMPKRVAAVSDKLFS